MICCLPSNSALKVWKNSSCVRSLPAKNWMSSISSASTCWNCRLNASIALSCSAFIIALKNCSLRRYITRIRGVVRAHRVAGGEHQVRLAQARAAVQQQRVVRAVAGLQRGLQRGGAAELVAAAFDEVVEGVMRVEVALEGFDRRRACAPAPWRRGRPAADRAAASRFPGSRRRCRRNARPVRGCGRGSARAPLPSRRRWARRAPGRRRGGGPARA